MEINYDYLLSHPKEVLVSDNINKFKGLTNIYKFNIHDTKYNVNTADDYEKIFYKEFIKLENFINQNLDLIFLISKFDVPENIWNTIFSLKLLNFLKNKSNVKFLFKEQEHIKKYGGYLNIKAKLVIYEVFDKEDNDLKLEKANRAKDVLHKLPMYETSNIQEAIKWYKNFANQYI